jgi:phosphatidylglycerol:prolipoprotein diacylglycerol transferase
MAQPADVEPVEQPPRPVMAPGERESGAATCAPARRLVLAADMPSSPVQVMSWSCESLADADPQALGLTYWFDAASTGEPYPVSIRFTGTRASGREDHDGRNAFQVVHTVDGVVPGSGRVALTVRVPGLAPGEWKVTATPVEARAVGSSAGSPTSPPGALPSGTARGATAFRPVVNVRAPGARIGAWPALVGIGWLVALTLQGVLAAGRGLPAGLLLLVSAVASVIGLAGAKVYYLLTHPEERRSPLTAGMSVQGFVLAAVGAVVLGGWWTGIPVGQLLDVTAPGLLFGMMIGRLGCLLGGCCVGRPTASRWGVWSSDRRVGVRRIPVQLLESGFAGLVATATLVALVSTDPAVGGLFFVAGLSVYTLGRQLLFPLRHIPRTTTHGRIVTLAATGLTALAAVAALLLT